MANLSNFTVTTNSVVKVYVSIAGNAKYIPTTITFNKSETVKTIKDRLEVVSGGNSLTSKITVFDKDDNFVCVLDNDDALLGSYHIDDNMRFHIDDPAITLNGFQDDSNVQKFELSPEEYEQRNENNGAEKTSFGIIGQQHKDFIGVISNMEVKQLRRPRKEPSKSQMEDLTSDFSKTKIASGSESDCSSTISESVVFSSNLGVKSTLRADAVEFYPSNYQEKKKIATEVCSDSYSADLPDSLVDNPIQDADIFLDLIEQQLTECPALFTNLMDDSADTFKQWAASPAILQHVASRILDFSTGTSSIAYLGAKMCKYIDEVISKNGLNFRADVLMVCETTHYHFSNLLEEFEKKAHGYVTFIAELYAQLEIKGKRIEQLGIALIENLTILVNSGTLENIKCVCKVLKLSGYLLEMDVPVILKDLMSLLSSEKITRTLDLHTINLLFSVISLASKNWGQNVTVTQPSQSVPEWNSGLRVYDGAYNEFTLTKEESDFMKSNCNEAGSYDVGNIVDESYGMDDEMEEAYEEFLSTVPKQ